MKHEPITPAEYRAFQQAYDFFNRQLFGGRLPHVLVLVTLWYPERFRLWFPRRARYSPFFKYINPDCFLSFRVAELFPLPTERSEGADGKGKSDTGSRIWFKEKPACGNGESVLYCSKKVLLSSTRFTRFTQA
jgi:hypothetical protein